MDEKDTDTQSAQNPASDKFNPFPLDGETNVVDVPPGVGLRGVADPYANSILHLLEAINRRPSVAGALLIITGYVVIAAFGEMDYLWKYGAYLSVLVVAYIFYWLNYKE